MGDFLSRPTRDAGACGITAELDVLFAAREPVPAEDVARYLNISMKKLMRLSDTGRIGYQVKGYGWRYYSRYNVERFLMIEGFPIDEELAAEMPVPAKPVQAKPMRPAISGNVISLAAERIRLRS
jgi:hypothetical protein